MRRRSKSSIEPGVLLVDKPAGPSSHAVVDWIRWVLREPRVGHCGTLDPAATGLLVVVVGAATRLATHLSDADKRYAARFVFGRSTTTADAEGETLEVEACGSADGARALEAVAALAGEHELAPPRFSAVKVGGVAAHVLARSDADHPDLEALALRPMTVRWVDGISAVADGPDGTVAIDATVEVSKGTYVRSLAALLGRRVGRPAHLGALRRLQSGGLSVDDPRTVGPLQASVLERGRDGKPRWRIRPMHGDEDRTTDRDAQARWLRERMLGLREAWPLPWIELPPGDEGEAALHRLFQGQPVALGAVDPSGAGSTGVLAGRVGIGRSARGGAFLVARVESGEIRPERTVVGPTAGGAA
jgi:tRNA pseudouridine55 synthase